ncbi:unnamed protein product [Nippostrongylus brasiliensis]|uniref:G protein-coupled receptor n=1 Tax=Nippostrongylus brasiliensis TaxID=27835 RepID=A0A158QXH2_NIPBR|nr:unnamed protein product [Nippostrongylus brasiliensis]
MMKLMNCTRCEVCAAAVNIYAPLSFVHLSLLFRLLLEPICTLGIILLTVAVYQTRALHFNARLLLTCMTTSVAVSNIGILIDAVYKLFISFVLPEELRCEYQVFKPEYFFAIRGLHIIGGLELALSTLCLAAERAFATITYATYEQNTRRWVGMSLLGIQMVICFSTTFSIRPPPQFYPYVSPDTNNSKRSTMAGNVLFALNIAALIIFSVLYLINRRRKVFYFHLPMLDEKTVVTSEVLEEVSHYAPYSEYQISLMPILTMMLIVLLPYFHIHIKRSFIRISHLKMCFPEPSTSIDTITVDEARDLYFEKLNCQWQQNAQRAHIYANS